MQARVIFGGVYVTGRDVVSSETPKKSDSLTARRSFLDVQPGCAVMEMQGLMLAGLWTIKPVQ